MATKPRVFLGGTFNNSEWRNTLIPHLKIEYFNPETDDWSAERMAVEVAERSKCHFLLYVVTPLMQGVYSIAEVIDDSNKRPEKTLFCVLDHDNYGKHNYQFSREQRRSMEAVKKLVLSNGGKVFQNLNAVAEFLNQQNLPASMQW